MTVFLALSVVTLSSREGLANEFDGTGSSAVATASDPANDSTRYLVAFTLQGYNVVEVGSFTSAGGISCNYPVGLVQTTGFPAYIGGQAVVAASSPTLTSNRLLFVTLYTGSSPVVGHVMMLAHSGSDSCAGWGGSWTEIYATSGHNPVSAPAATTFSSGGNVYDYVAVRVYDSGVSAYRMDVAYRKNGGSFTWDTSLTGTDWGSQPALTAFNDDVYLFGVSGSDHTVVLENHAAIDTSDATLTWNSSTYTGVSFVNGSGLYYADEACSATANTSTVLVVCGDNQSPIHYWANVYNGSNWSSATTWYDQGNVPFVDGGSTWYDDTRPSAGFYSDYSNSTHWMLLGASNTPHNFHFFDESDYTGSSWTSWARRL